MNNSPNTNLPPGDTETAVQAAQTTLRGAPSRARNSGVALIIVLGMLVLLSIIVVAFLTSVTTDLNDSKGYEAQTNVRMLADSTVNLVIGEIRLASTGTGVAWVSQPGLIRTYDVSGSAVKAYKLYSSGSMIVAGTFNPLDIDGAGNGDYPLATTWVNQPNLWVDMNSPVTSSNGNTVFPIIDGNGMQSLTVNGTSVYTYTTDGTTQDVQGFYSNPPTTLGTYSTSSSLSGTNNPVPMPVQWLYMLKDGTLLSATAASSTTKDVTLVDPNNALASGTNPIVGRIAFWTDDETAKVNINTASEGTYWDTPISNGQNAAASGSAPQPYDDDYIYEWDLAERQGDKNEYQRYPGHPATTCLSTILGSTVKYSLFGSNPSTLTATQRAAFVEAFAQITPRVSGSGVDGHDYSSQGGTRRAGLLNQAPTDNGSYPVVVDSDRLYANSDELLYNLARQLQSMDSSGSNSAATQILTGSSGDPRTLLRKMRFFLTADSKAPETNLFNLPRVAIWPITKPIGSLDTPSDTTKMTAFDQLIAFCSTVQTVVNSGTTTKAFYYTRADPTSSSYDMNNGTRNQAVYKYLSTLMGKSIPGFGGTFSAKYPTAGAGAEYNQILTEIFDYIRTTNLVDTSGDAKQPTDSGYSTTDAAASKSYTLPAPYTLGQTIDNFAITKRGQVVPIGAGVTLSGSAVNTRGYGRILTISEVAIGIQQMTGTHTVNDPTTGQPKPDTVNVQFVIAPAMHSPSAGFSALANDIRLRFTNFHLGFKRSGTDANNYPMFSGSSSDPGKVGSGSYPYADIYNSGRLSKQDGDESHIGGPVGIRALTEDSTGNAAPLDSMFPVSQVTVQTGTGLLSGSATMSGTDTITVGNESVAGSGSFDIEVWAPATNGTKIQTFNVVLPSFTAPFPTSQSSFYMKLTDKSTPNAANGYSGASRGWTIFNNSTNTVRSVFIKNWDMRNVACTGSITNVSASNPVWLETGGTFSGTASAPYYDKTAKIVCGIRKGALYQGDDSTGGEVAYPMAGTLWFGKLPSWPVGTGSNVGVQTTYSNDVGLLAFEWNGSTTSDISGRPIVPAGVYGVFNSGSQVGDWDNGPAFVSDGGYMGKPDEGSNRHTHEGGGFPLTAAPYIGFDYASEDGATQPATLFSPNRQVSSPVMFGSLPTGVLRKLPWQTLLFRPAKDYFQGGVNHPGAAIAASGGQSPATQKIPYPPYSTPPDHLILDLFWMPVVEPYPISEPFATAGKINLNYQIAPFTYIRRDTGLRAVMQSVKITALDPNFPTSGQTFSQTYKKMGSLVAGSGDTGGGKGFSSRRSIDVDKTLMQTDWRFAQNQPFRSASEICDIPLVPANRSQASYLNAQPSSFTDVDTKLAAFWNCNAGKSGGTFTNATGNWLTGDNSLERPYSMLYPRLTTKSNTYTIHVRVQSLKKATTTAYNIFKDGQDQVTGEFRGSFLIERYLDPTNTGFAIGSGTVTSANNELTFNAQLGQYKFRVISSKQFTP